MAAVAAADNQLLTFRVGARRFALHTGEVAEVVRQPKVTRVPHAPPSLAGVASLRGQVVPVVSLARLLGEAERPASASSRVILLDRAQPLALEVDEVTALKAASGEETVAPGQLLMTEAGAARLVDLDGLLQGEFARALRPAGRRTPAAEPVAETAVRAAAAEIALLGFELAGQAYALPLEQVREVIALPEELAALPRTDAAMVGVAAWRGALLPIASARALLGLAPAALTGAERVVLTAIGDAVVGLLVEQLNAILRAPETAVGPVPRVLNRGAGEAQIDAMLRTADARLVSILAPERLFRDESVAQILADGQQKAVEMSASDTDGDVEQFVVFTLGEERYGLPIAAVEEVVNLPEVLTRAPRAPAFVAGVMNLRGAVIPVIEQRQRFGVAGAAPAGRRRVIVTRVAGVSAGFIVDSVSEILKLPARALAPTPDLTADASRLFDRVAHVEVDGRMILLVDPQELLDRTEADLLAAVAQAAPQAS